MGPLRISRMQHIVVAVFLLGFWLSSISNTRAEYEFISQDIGFPVQYFEPVDIEDDGVWELALQVGHAGDSVGVYSPLLRRWIDGPYQFTFDYNNWGCGDFDDDGQVEYAYFNSSSVWLADPAAGTDSVVFSIEDGCAYLGGNIYECLEISPKIMQVWGYGNSGEPTVHVSRYESYYIEYSSWAEHFEHCHWVRYSLTTGQKLDSIRASPQKGRICFIDDTYIAASLCVFSSRNSWTLHWNMGGLLRNSLILLDDQSQEIMEKELYYHLISANNVPSWWEPHGRWASTWRAKMVHAAIGRPRPDGLPESFCLFDGNHLEHWRLAGVVSDQSPLNWQMSIDSLLHSGLAYHDCDGDSTSELLLPLTDQNLWEIRDPQTGNLIDSIPGLPPADIRTAPIMETDVLDLYYFLDSTLFILSRPGMPTNTTEEPDDPQEPLLPTSFALHQNYPNPFNASTVIKFDLGEPASVKLDIYNILGQKVAALLDAPLPGGFHQIEWDGKNDKGQDVVSGMYFYRLTTGDLARTRKMVLLR